MSLERSKRKDHKPLSTPSTAGVKMSNDLSPLGPHSRPANIYDGSQGLLNLHVRETDADPALIRGNNAEAFAKPLNDSIARSASVESRVKKPGASPKAEKKEKKDERDRVLLAGDRWFARNGHLFTYIGLFLFSIMVLFRPYELITELSFLSATAFYFALATLAIYVPSQLAAEGSLTIFSTEVKAVSAMTVVALITIPIAKDPSVAWTTFNDAYIKSVIIFIVIVNVVRTRKRLMGMIWLSFGIGVYLSISSLILYMDGKFSVESYRVAITEVKGMFGNPNEMALHFVMMTPLAIALGIAEKNRAMRLFYFAAAGLFVAANMVTYSRGGFLGLIACSMVLAWKLGRKYRLNVTIASLLFGGLAILAAPGNYGLRMLSIFVPGLDPVGSSDQRKELLWQSLLITARNPWGVGIGNFPIVGIRNLQTHNAFTQVSSELGLLGLVAYLILMISPFRKLQAIERTLFEADDYSWFYYLAIGLQASIIGYMVSSFFASVAYNWFIYYLIAYAVAFRRIYRIEAEHVSGTEGVKALEQQPA
ncbi:MAG: O-antigen ligase family protein [Pyrinomonadaceae bacterium]